MNKSTKNVLSVVLVILLVFTEFCALFGMAVNNTISKEKVLSYISSDAFINDMVGNALGGEVVEGDNDVVKIDSNTDIGALLAQQQKKEEAEADESYVPNQNLAKFLRSSTAADIFAESLTVNIKNALYGKELIELDHQAVTDATDTITNEFGNIDDSIVSEEVKKDLIEDISSNTDFVVSKVNETLKTTYESIKPINGFVKFISAGFIAWQVVAVLIALVLIVINLKNKSAFFLAGIPVLLSAVILRMVNSSFINLFSGNETVRAGLLTITENTFSKSVVIGVIAGVALIVAGIVMIIVSNIKNKAK